MEKLQGKVALVSGGAQGLGQQICYQLAEAGAMVIAGDIQEEKAAGTVKTITDKGGKAVAMRLDVSSEESVKTTIEKIKNEYGSLNILVNNAGIDFTKSIMELSVSEWDAAFSVNLRGPFLMSKYGMVVMSEQKSGNIINIVSTASLRAWTEASVYHASKWGLRGFSHALFTEARKVNVKVTAIIAGGMSTPFLLDRFPDIPPQNLQDPKNVATKIRYIIEDDTDTVVPEILILPLMETSWP